jgi:selenocysteine lyase/cysteine desulfurase
MSLSPPAYDLAAWRSRIPLATEMVLMQNCSQTPQCDRTRAAADAYLDSWRTAGMDWDSWVEEVEAAKLEFARLVKATPAEVGLSSSVSDATSSLASALVPREGRNKIVLTEAEFPGVAHVWVAAQRYGFELAWVPLRDGIVRLEDYDDYIDERTLLVSATHVYYQNGFRQDVAAIAKKAHDAGALIYVDAYQSAGCVPIDVKAMDVDILSAGNLKFLFGVPGVAFLYVKEDLLPQMEPARTGWFGRSDVFAFNPRLLDWAPTAARFETGTPPVIAAYIARAGMSVVNEVGVENIRAWTKQLAGLAAEAGRARGLVQEGPADPELRNPTTAFLVPGGDSHLAEALMRKRGVLSPARGPVLRFAPHFYSTPEDVEAALDAFVSVLESDEFRKGGHG